MRKCVECVVGCEGWSVCEGMRERGDDGVVGCEGWGVCEGMRECGGIRECGGV